MKTIPAFLMGLIVPVVAGTPAMETAAPAPDPCSITWFAGGSVGYLTELEEPMYNLHLGADTCWNLGGWNVSLFAEIGYAEKDESWSGRDQLEENRYDSIDGDYDIEFRDDKIKAALDLEEIDDLLSDVADYYPLDTGYDFDVMPITLNAKLERQFSNNLGAYFGAGLGMALVDFSADIDRVGNFSDDDWVFVGQIFAGLNYNFNPNFEVYGGVRWIYYDDAGLGDNDIELDLEMDDDFLLEIGARFNF